MSRSQDGELGWKTGSDISVEDETEQVGNGLTSDSAKEEKIYVPSPEIDEQLLTVNKWSRPGKKTEEIQYLVIHYLGNPRTSAQENRDYFESLKDLKDVSMSANYIVGLEGEIIRCVPEGEVAYASNHANKESISIENCNIDRTGKFLRDTYISLVHLTAYLADKYDLDREHIIRHYDVTGKSCPLYYVENEDAWERFLDDVMAYKELCEKKPTGMEEYEHSLKGLKDTYSSKYDGSVILETSEDEDGRPHDYEEGYDAEDDYAGEDEEGAYDEGSYEEAPYEEGSYEEGPYEEGPYEEGSYEETPYVEVPYEEVPYEETPYVEVPYSGGYEEGADSGYQEPVYTE